MMMMMMSCGDYYILRHMSFSALPVFFIPFPPSFPLHRLRLHGLGKSARFEGSAMLYGTVTQCSKNREDPIQPTPTAVEIS